MSASKYVITAPCPRCGVDLVHHGAIHLMGFVAAEDDPEGKARADLILSCDACETDLNAFVPVNDFLPVEDGEGKHA